MNSIRKNYIVIGFTLLISCVMFVVGAYALVTHSMNINSTVSFIVKQTSGRIIGLVTGDIDEENSTITPNYIAEFESISDSSVLEAWDIGSLSLLKTDLISDIEALITLQIVNTGFFTVAVSFPNDEINNQWGTAMDDDTDNLDVLIRYKSSGGADYSEYNHFSSMAGSYILIDPNQTATIEIKLAVIDIEAAFTGYDIQFQLLIEKLEEMEVPTGQTLLTHRLSNVVLPGNKFITVSENFTETIVARGGYELPSIITVIVDGVVQDMNASTYSYSKNFGEIILYSALLSSVENMIEINIVAGLLPISIWQNDDLPISEFSSGTGTAENPFLITNGHELYYLSYVINEGKCYQHDGHVVINADAEDDTYNPKYSEANYRLTKSISLNDEKFTFEKDTGLIKITDQVRTFYMGSGIKGYDNGSNTDFDIVASHINSYYYLNVNTYVESILDTNTGLYPLGGDLYLGTGIVGTNLFNTTASKKGVYYTKVGEDYNTIVNGDIVERVNYWQPIGNSINFFKGHIDFSNCILEGIYIVANNKNAGLIGNMVGGSVKDITLKNGFVSSLYENVGGIVGNVVNGNFKGLLNSNIVVSSSNYVGGIAGKFLGILANSENRNVVNGLGSYTGGIAGYKNGPTDNCSNYGDVYGNQNIGGVFGYLSGDGNKLANLGDIWGSNDVVGGCFGVIYNGRLYNCYNCGIVEGNSMVGGIVGLIGENFYSFNIIVFYLTNSFNSGNVTCRGVYAGGVVGKIFCGNDPNAFRSGMYVQKNFGLVNIYNSGSVICLGSSLYVGNIWGDNRVSAYIGNKISLANYLYWLNGSSSYNPSVAGIFEKVDSMYLPSQQIENYSFDVDGYVTGKSESLVNLLNTYADTDSLCAHWTTLNCPNGYPVFA